MRSTAPSEKEPLRLQTTNVRITHKSSMLDTRSQKVCCFQVLWVFDAYKTRRNHHHDLNNNIDGEQGETERVRKCSLFAFMMKRKL